MDALSAALLVNLLGFMLGIALYSMLGVMVIVHWQSSERNGVNYLLLAAAVLGTLWNLGELVVAIGRDFGTSEFPLISAAAYAALGFLPPVVVHSAGRDSRQNRFLAIGAYSLSVFAATMHLRAAFSGAAVPDPLAMQVLTAGAVALAVAMLALNLRETIRRKTIWAAGLMIFAVSAVHLGSERTENSWLVELIAHQSSLPLAFAILYQNFRFAFADLFLKRAISLLLLAGVALLLYSGIASPVLRFHESHDRNDVFAISLIILLWVITGLIYPFLHSAAAWLVDAVILKRSGYKDLPAVLVAEMDAVQSEDAVLSLAAERLGETLSAGESKWEAAESGETQIVRQSTDLVSLLVPTATPPKFRIILSRFRGGRRLLSDELAMLGSAAIAIARKIDSIRITHDLCEREYREQEYAKLAAEAQLAALRSQINPHFLFNALTTITYLIQESPKKAGDTLLRLTRLLRGMLGKTAEFSTLGDELDLISNYLEIEKARFEDRLRVSYQIAEGLRSKRIPSLILQPLVENAIKHGIAELSHGGEVIIAADEITSDGKRRLRLSVRNTAAPRKKPTDGGGHGLTNIRQRLAAYYDGESQFSLTPDGQGGMVAEILLPLSAAGRRAA